MNQNLIGTIGKDCSSLLEHLLHTFRELGGWGIPIGTLRDLLLLKAMRYINILTWYINKYYVPYFK